MNFGDLPHWFDQGLPLEPLLLLIAWKVLSILTRDRYAMVGIWWGATHGAPNFPVTSRGRSLPRAFRGRKGNRVAAQGRSTRRKR